jgi:glucokinase
VALASAWIAFPEDGMADQFALGLDFGGTKVLAAVINVTTGEVLASSKKRTKATDGPDELIARLVSSSESAIKGAKLPKKSKICGIGVGIAGQVDAERGILIGTPNLSQATVDLPIAARLSDHFGVPTALRNDVQVAALGESAFGAGKAAPDFLCIFVGTGIGGALVRGGRLLSGASGAAGEIGHLVVAAGGRLCGCGGRGHLEAYASRTAMTKVLMAELHRGRDSILRDMADTTDEDGGAALRSGVVAKAIEAGDELTIETVKEGAYYLGLGIASAINILNPSRIVLGGGVIEAVPMLYDIAVARARNEALPAASKAATFAKAGLGDNAGVVGAAMLGALAATS